MVATPYEPVSWTSDQVTQSKLAKMANNDQWLFENSPKLRYSANGLIRETGVKFICGKSPYPVVNSDWLWVTVNFGSFFSAGCKPIVTAVIEAPNWAKKYITIRGLGGEVDNRGFVAVVASHEGAYGPTTITEAGFLHWQAWGY